MPGATPTGTVRPPSDGPRKRGGRYELGTLLGRGGMAEVFSGHALGDHGFQKPVAIKRLLPELATDLVFVARLIDEAKLLVGMQHGNIVSVLDLARDGDDVFLVMEFVDGPSLRQLIKARAGRGLSFGIATYVIAAAAAGLQFAHTRPTGAIIHADISPSNLLLTTSGEVRVADFGIARRENQSGFGVEGKWAYMAPEQARGEALSPASDVFALGVVLYELLTGVHPLGQKATADDRAGELGHVPPPRALRPAVPAALDAICMRCLAAEASDRYARMQDLIDAITDARFACGYREGASELAAAIAEVAPAIVAPTRERTQTTDLPPANVTLVTRSLLSSPRTQPSTPAAIAQFGPPEGALAVGTASRNRDGQLVTPIDGVAAIPAEPPRRRWGLYIVGAALLAGGGAALAIQMGPSELPSAPVATPAPIAVAPAIVPVPMPAPTPAPVAAPLPAPAEVEIENDPAADAPPPKPVARPIARPSAPHAAKAPTKAAPAAAPVEREAGTVRISTTTWAYAAIDGGAPQEVSMVRAFALPAGRHTVRVFNDDLHLKPVTRTITIEANHTSALKVDLEVGTAKEID